MDTNCTKTERKYYYQMLENIKTVKSKNITAKLNKD